MLRLLGRTNLNLIRTGTATNATRLGASRFMSTNNKLQYSSLNTRLVPLTPFVKCQQKSPSLFLRFASTTSEGNQNPVDLSAIPEPTANDRAVARWLYVMAGLVFAMVVLGGVTRLTQSGLSITDWRPVTGTIPPLSDEDWESEFDKYRLSPEFKVLNSSMTMSEFKRIYYYEWSHRFLGRFIGVAFAIPFAYFASRGYLTSSLKRKLAVILGLGGLQGFIGWWMVKSGLKEDQDHPRVSPYRLATHLGSAFVIYLLLLQTAHSIALPARKLAASAAISPRVFKGAHVLAHMTFWTAMAGAFVAGLDAGLVYPTWPKMGQGYIPPDYNEIEPAWKNVFENPAAVQFNHRNMAYATYIATTIFYFWARKQPLTGAPRMTLHALFAMVNLQAALGIATLLYYVPTPLAASHQAGSLTLLTIILTFMMQTRRIPIRPPLKA